MHSCRTLIASVQPWIAQRKVEPGKSLAISMMVGQPLGRSDQLNIQKVCLI